MMEEQPRRRLARRQFSEQEDMMIRELVAEVGEDDWPAISEHFQGRTPRQCKERWNHYLSPQVIHDKWSVEEDDLLNELVNQRGKKWKAFEHFFSGRTDINLKNRYNVLIRRKAKQYKIEMKLPLKTKRKVAPQQPSPSIEEPGDCFNFLRPEDFDEICDPVGSVDFAFF
jgi:hypothetical protein